MPKTLIAVALSAAAILALPAAADASAGSGTATMRSNGRSITVDVQIHRFATTHGRTVAVATAASRVRTRDGKVRAASKNVHLSVKAGSNCKILTLSLDQLKLTLLGLTVDTSAVNLHITGDRTRSLGKLFCSLAQGIKLSSPAKQARASAALNRHMRHRPMHALRFRAAISPQARASQAQVVCPVLSLTLGPLNLDLLGLIVDLYGANTKAPVVVTITADPNGGSLGKLFCTLAQNAQTQSGSTPPATAPGSSAPSSTS